ncbi:heparan-alpha-glucosaminide N-acetyltransferase [Methylobacterium oryzisoli]|uniref:heparan-alpha-glucosaminide N-acetyltransferase n=1 Tax=Methylobacterium oryzisoli TaxID=3385502 RepID=UPI00397A9C8A
MPLPARLRRLLAPAAPAAPVRLAGLDAARGAALVAMALYHLTWNLGFLRLTPENYALSPLGRACAHAIAASFLTLVGIGLVLAQGKGFRPRPFLARLGRIAAAAGAISLATRLAFPQSWIFFGILHCIALSSVLALPALRAPRPLVVAAAAGAFAAPALAAWSGADAGFLDAPALLFLGLGRTVPATNDYVPLFPWIGFVLAGIALARLGLTRLAPPNLHARPWRLLAAAGRHSLAIYLVHQPVLFGLAAGAAALTGPHPRAGEGAFLREYRETCAAAGGEADVCRVAARCLLVRLREEGLWQAAERGTLTDEARERAVAASQDCFRRAKPG